MLRTANTNPTPYSSLVGIIWYKAVVTTSILEFFKRKVTVENFIKEKERSKENGRYGQKRCNVPETEGGGFHFIIL